MLNHYISTHIVSFQEVSCVQNFVGVVVRSFTLWHVCILCVHFIVGYGLNIAAVIVTLDSAGERVTWDDR